MADPVRHLEPNDRSRWLDVDTAAERLDITPRGVRMKCVRWQMTGLAQKGTDGWLISPRADSRLRSAFKGCLHVTEQAGLLIKHGVPTKLVDVAKTRAAVVEAYWRFRSERASHSICQTRSSFIGSWATLDLPFKNPISVKSLERWERLYRNKQLDQLVPSYNGLVGKKGHWSKSARELFYRLYFGPGKRQVATCYQIMRGEAIKHKWKIPALRSVQRHVADDVPEDTKTLFREGNQAFRAKAEPKIRRDYGDLPAGEHIEGDERTCDFYVRVPSAKGWKRIRPIMTAWIDRRSRIIFGWWLDARGNSDTILASFKRGVLDYGRPKELTIDNGEDYKSVAGNPRKRRSRWSDFDGERVEHCFTELDIQVHLTLPYTPWSKGHIESFFSTMSERFDKFMTSYCGNKPENRPEGATKIPVEQLPTLEEARSRFEDFAKAYHDTPHSGDGMNGLSPSQAHEQYLGTVSPVSAEALDYLCAKRVGPKKVGQNGILHRHVMYGQRDQEIWKLRGRQVWLRLLPDVADKVWVETEDGKPICMAKADRIVGATQDNIRTAAKVRKERRKATRKYFEDVVPKRHATPIQDIHEAQRIAAQADQIETPEPPTPATVRLTRPDLEAALHANAEPVSEEILPMPVFEEPPEEEVLEMGSAFGPLDFDEDDVIEGDDDLNNRLRRLADAG